eukprot:1345563-Amorphochlora_amoeboformis.AAC.1
MPRTHRSKFLLEAKLRGNEQAGYPSRTQASLPRLLRLDFARRLLDFLIDLDLEDLELPLVLDLSPVLLFDLLLATDVGDFLAVFP